MKLANLKRKLQPGIEQACDSVSGITHFIAEKRSIMQVKAGANGMSRKGLS